MEKKFKIAIIIETCNVNYCLYKFITYLTKNYNYDQPILILNKYSFYKKKRKKLLNYFLNNILLSIILFIERIIISRTNPKLLDTFNFQSFPNVKSFVLTNINNNSEFQNKLTKSDLDKLRKENIDLVLSSSYELLNEEILRISTFGAIIFYPFSNYKNQFNLFALSEIINKKDTINLDIISCKSIHNDLEILFKGKVCPRSTWLLTRSYFSIKSNFFLKKLIEDLARKRKFSTYVETRSNSHIYKYDFLDKSHLLLKYIITNLLRKILNKLINKFRGKKINRWSIAYSKSKLIDYKFSNFKEVKNPYGRFFADPFLFNLKDRNYIFVEDYFFNEEKGKISVIDISEENEKFLGVVLEEKFHLSFPYVFKSEGRIYMVPESHESKEIRLYECNEFPMKWSYKCTLMNNISAVDTILFQKEEIWYMLTNICSSKIDDHTSELHVFYSNSLITDKWRPIKSGNPVIFNSQKARNGGLIERRGEIYRINQVSNLNGYGYAFDINLIEKINEEIYIEKEIKRVNPIFFSNIKGTHHFNSNIISSVVDFHREISEKEVFRNE